MRRRLQIILSLVAIAMAACCITGCKTGTFASEHGRDDVAYIDVVSSDAYAGKKVTVTIDGTTEFTVKVQKSKQSTEKHNGDLYGIRPGRRSVKVVYDGKTLYEKEIFLSSQQTKIIQL
ncbi:MAG: DUF4831 family protein [Muribaculaceae bacterium]